MHLKVKQKIIWASINDIFKKVGNNVYKDINKYEAAINSYKKAIEVNNNYATAYKSLGDTFHIIRR